jgi:hypothetical protein
MWMSSEKSHVMLIDFPYHHAALTEAHSIFHFLKLFDYVRQKIEWSSPSPGSFEWPGGRPVDYQLSSIFQKVQLSGIKSKIC